MGETKSYFFCGIGGSGMLPLASIVKARGHVVAGSDRALDQGRIGDKFTFLERQGIALSPQNGSGLTSAEQILVTSAAVEDTIPDVVAATRLGAARITRPQLLAGLFNEAETGIAVGGTSGKSTVTGMIAWILYQAGRDPTVMNGAVMKNFASPERPFASALAGQGGDFVAEVDESDGSIALYRPEIAVLTNVSLDHKSLDELRALFGGFVAAANSVVLNRDDAESRHIGEGIPGAAWFSLSDGRADFFADEIAEQPLAIAFTVRERGGDPVAVRLQVPGRHNVANALAAIAAVRAAGVGLGVAADALAGFRGLGRRFDIVGTANGVTVIDDFGHNPDKIAATLATLHAFPGRLLVMFQPHGYGPLRVMREALIDCFTQQLGDEDVLIMTDPVYFGGTVDRSVGSGDIIAGVRAPGRNAEHVPIREDAGRRLVALARPGDRIAIMGARDDTLSLFARETLAALN